MNKLFLSIIIFIISTLLYVVYDLSTDNDSELANLNAVESLNIDIIKPPVVVNMDRNKFVTDLSVRYENKNKRPKQETTITGEEYQHPFTAKGQAYVTLGELLIGSNTRSSTAEYTADLARQLKQAKYNLKISKEMASLSKNLLIDSKNGKKIDKEVYKKINKLRMNLIVELKD
ncbi:MAG: hypothetical protein L3J83_00320 [Proteobacteria bacterium]|nr:hypothetical protein [Pseudomonadota bacterium]